VVTYHGDAEARQVILKHDWKRSEPREIPSGVRGGTPGGAAASVRNGASAGVAGPGGEARRRRYRYKFDVVLTTFEMVVAQPAPLRRIRWAYLVVDEGHRLKNRHSRVLEELHEVRTRRKLVLTGTPLQNHVGELWSILHFLAPRKFDDADEFLDAFGALSTGGGTVQQVRRLTRRLEAHACAHHGASAHRFVNSRDCSSRTCSGARRRTSRRCSRCARLSCT
jgi:SNF2 family DNA or RNA helicase